MKLALVLLAISSSLPGAIKIQILAGGTHPTTTSIVRNELMRQLEAMEDVIVVPKSPDYLIEIYVVQRTFAQVHVVAISLSLREMADPLLAKAFLSSSAASDEDIHGIQVLLEGMSRSAVTFPAVGNTEDLPEMIASLVKSANDLMLDKERICPRNEPDVDKVFLNYMCRIGARLVGKNGVVRR